jgi:hypothetical protein
MNKRHQHTELNIIIDRLVVEGMNLTVRQKQLLQQTIAVKLRDHFMNSDAGVNIPDLSMASTISAGTIHLTENETATASLGTEIAGSVFNGINNPAG